MGSTYTEPLGVEGPKLIALSRALDGGCCES
jgi:hypothetical protein